MLLLLFSASSIHAAAGPAHSEVEAWSFKPGSGLTLSEDATKALGMTTSEVRSANIIPERGAVTVQIYRPASEGATPDGKASGSFFLPAEEAGKLAAGQPFALRKNTSSFEAVVASVKVPAEGNGGLVEVLAAIADPNAELHAGDFLEARLSQTKGARSGVTAIPVSAVVESVRGPFVYAANGSSFLRTPVKLGAEQNGTVEVTDGLFEGDVIVTNGAPGLWMIELQAVNGGKGCGAAH
jgi:multidrug efflux pump subunit AcrA (membrane-fusion protein)